MAVSGDVSIALFATVIGSPAGITSASFSRVFSVSNIVAQKLSIMVRKKERETQ